MTSRIGQLPRINQNQNCAFPLPVRIFSIYDIMHMQSLKIYSIIEYSIIDYSIIEIMQQDRILLKSGTMQRSCVR